DLDRGQLDGAAVPDHVVEAAVAQQLWRELLRTLLTDEVEHHLRTACGEVVDRAGDRLVVGHLHGVVGAQVAGELHRLLALLQHGHRAGGQRLEHLDADVSQPAGADHDGVRPGHQVCSRLAYSVVGGQSGVRERCDVGRLQRLVQLDHGAGVGAQLLGHPTVDVQAGEGGVLAVRIIPGAARSAQPAAGQRVHDHRIPGGYVGHRGPDLAHPAGVLVTEDVGQLRVLDLFPLAFDDVQVGAAHARSADVDDHVPRAGDLGVGHVL